VSLEPYLEPSQVVRHLTTPVRRFPIALLFVLSLAMAFAVFSVSIPIGQADLEQRESRNVFLLIVGAVGLALLFTRSFYRSARDSLTVLCLVPASSAASAANQSSFAGSRGASRRAESAIAPTQFCTAQRGIDNHGHTLRVVLCLRHHLLRDS
jgi:hypothetical protein